MTERITAVLGGRELGLGAGSDATERVAAVLGGRGLDRVDVTERIAAVLGGRELGLGAGSNEIWPRARRSLREST